MMFSHIYTVRPFNKLEQFVIANGGLNLYNNVHPFLEAKAQAHYCFYYLFNRLNYKCNKSANT